MKGHKVKFGLFNTFVYIMTSLSFVRAQGLMKPHLIRLQRGKIWKRHKVKFGLFNAFVYIMTGL